MAKLKQSTLYLGLLLLVLTAMACIRLFILSRQPLPPRDWADVEQEGVLRMGVEYSRTGYHVAGDSIAGFDYELCRAIGRRSGLRVGIYPEANLSRSLDALAEQRIDVVAQAIPITVSHKETLGFTRPIQTQRLVLVQRKAEHNDGIEPIRNQLHLARQEVYIPAGSPARHRLDNLAVEIADSIYVVEDPLYGEEQLIMLVARGEIDYAICSSQTAQALASTYPELDIATDVGFNQFRGWALRKDSPVLLDSLNAWLEAEMASPEFEQLRKQYEPEQPKKRRK